MRNPDASGPFGDGWLLKQPANPKIKDWEASVASWILKVPGAHPYWSWWQLSIVSLRDIQGVPPAKKIYQTAEYEFLIIALNPERGKPDVDAIERGDDYGDPKQSRYLFPHDFACQFHGVTDHHCRKIAAAAVRGILLGSMSPDSDFSSRWKRSIDDTLRCIAGGNHDGARVI